MDSERRYLKVNGFVVAAQPSGQHILGDYKEGEIDAPLVDGVFSGKGTEKLTKDGKEYTLECVWENGKKNGEGVVLNEYSILVMKLRFVNDVIDGEGCIYENGHIQFKGIWKNGVRCGFGQEFAGGKLLFKGMYADDVRNGYGVSYSVSGDPVFEGEWVNGSPGKKEIIEDELGNRVLIEKDDEDHVIYKGGFKEGSVLRDGIGTVFDASGACIKMSVYSEDMEERCVRSFANGAMTQFDASGHKIYEGSFIMTPHGPVAQGEGRQFSPAGVPLYQGEFHQGHRSGFGRSFVNRTLQYEGMWANDQANGRGKLFDPAGMLLVEGEFQDDLCSTGTESFHRERGKVSSRGKGCFCRRSRPSLPTVSRGEFDVKEVSDLARAGNVRHVTVMSQVWGGIDTLGVTDLAAMEEIVFQGDETPAMPNQFATLQKHERIFISQCNALREIRFLRNACAEVLRLRIEGGITAGITCRGSAVAIPRDWTCGRNSRGLVVLLVGVVAVGEWVPAGKSIVDLPALETLQIGDGSFRNVKSVSLKSGVGGKVIDRFAGVAIAHSRRGGVYGTVGCDGHRRSHCGVARIGRVDACGAGEECLEEYGGVAAGGNGRIDRGGCGVGRGRVESVERAEVPFG